MARRPSAFPQRQNLILPRCVSDFPTREIQSHEHTPAPQLTVSGKKNILFLQSDTMFEEGGLFENNRIRASGQDHGGGYALLLPAGL